MKVTLQGYIEVPEMDLPKIIDELPTHIDATRKEDGCLIFDVIRDKKHKNRFSVFEVFRNQAAFDFHQKRSKSSRWGEVAKNVIRKYEITLG